MIAGVSLIEQHVIQFKNGTMVNDNMSVKNIVSVKMRIVGILAHGFFRMVNISKVLLIL